MKRLGFNIILLGMIAAGKETQAAILKKRYALTSVESGVYVRKLLKEKSAEGDIARRTAGKGKPLHSLLFRKFLVKEISKKPKNKDLLFLGTPRLKPEAQLVKKILSEKKQDFMALYISLPDKEVYRRSLKRRESGVHELYKMLDDKKIIKTRIAWHKDQVGKTVTYFEKLGKLAKINGNQPIPKVTKDILRAVEAYKRMRA